MSRPRREPTDDWAQLHLLVTSPEQHAYEVLRPVVLFGQPIPVRARETGISERTLQTSPAHPSNWWGTSMAEKRTSH